MMYGLLVLSLVLARKQSSMLYSGLLFATLLCFKHIYLYLAPAYFVFLLRAYCLSQKSIFKICFGNCIKLGVGIIGIFGLAFGPYLYWGQIDQLLSRLFPFSRGLCHAYWAPNVWAMYSFTDRVLIAIAPKLGLPVNLDALNSVTRGLVGDTSFAVLPNITPRMTFVLTLFFQSVCTSLLLIVLLYLLYLACTDKVILSAYMGGVYRCHHSMWLCFILVRLARS
jgi:alpha-1,3-glucosyltransferase